MEIAPNKAIKFARWSPDARELARFMAALGVQVPHEK